MIISVIHFVHLAEIINPKEVFGNVSDISDSSDQISISTSENEEWNLKMMQKEVRPLPRGERKTVKLTEPP